jgi:hypothetical protein
MSAMPQLSPRPRGAVNGRKKLGGEMGFGRAPKLFAISPWERFEYRISHKEF